jgi:hypothetical protein
MDEKTTQVNKKYMIKKSKNIEDKNQKYDMIKNDLINDINNINENFDFKTFNKDTLSEVEIVRK